MDDCAVGSTSAGQERYAGGGRDAGSEAETVCWFPKGVCGGLRRASRWSAAGEPRRSGDNPPKHPMKENQMQMGGADCLPLVGPGAIAEVQISKDKPHYGRKPMQSGGGGRLPLVGPGAPAEFRLLNPTTHHGGKQLQSGGGGRLPLVGHEDQNPIRKETQAAGSPRSRLQAHSSMRKCCASV